MVVQIVAVNDDVVDIDKCDLPLVSTEYLVGQTLENARTCLQTKRHPFELVQAFVCAEGSLRLIFFIDFDLVKTFIGVEGGKVRLAGELTKDVIDSRDWVLVGLEYGVYLAIVDAEPILSFLSDKNSR
jgi:hypothetical protein